MGTNVTDHGMMMSHHPVSFYMSENVTILFNDWITKTSLAYTFSLFAIIGLGIFNAYLKSIRERLVHQKQFQTKSTSSPQKEGTDEKDLEIGVQDNTFAFVDPIKKCCTCVSSPSSAFFVMCLTFVITMFNFCLMLIAMTFETGVFLSTCLGISIGYMLFQYPAMLGKPKARKTPVETKNEEL